MSDRIPLVYILSNGRSGTTLLDLLLGAHDHVWTTGEAQNLPWELVNPRAPCGCGNPVHESPFWKPILPDIPTDTDGYHVGCFHNSEQVGKVLRWNLLPDLIRGRARPRWRDAVEEYGRKNETLFRVVREAAEERSGNEIQWLVDASKNVYRLFWLQQSGRFDLRVIHVMKDPRALVYSMARPWLPSGIHRVLRYTGRWIVENALMAHLCRVNFDPEHVRRLSYETLAGAPEETMEAIGEWLGVDYPPELVHNFKDYENFAISGNMMRWRESDDDIRLDERWKSRLPVAYQHLVHMLTVPFRRFCGYTQAEARL
jgi:hypothetical protein